MDALDFSDFTAIDARYVHADMQGGIALQLRAEDAPGLHPLLPMRMSRMEGGRLDMVALVQEIIENPAAMEVPEMTNIMLMRITRAESMLMRVLECANAPVVNGQVTQAAVAISSSLGFMAKSLSMSEHLAADVVKRHAENMKRFADEVDQEAQACQEIYHGMVIEPLNLQEIAAMQVEMSNQVNQGPR